jgi:GcrA cell cycle regulator
MGWTDERVSTLKKLWQDGLSASQIAKQLGGVTRNAVIGKVHRLGLSGRAAPSQPSRPVFKAPRPAARRGPAGRTAPQPSRAPRGGPGARCQPPRPRSIALRSPGRPPC